MQVSPLIRSLPLLLFALVSSLRAEIAVASEIAVNLQVLTQGADMIAYVKRGRHAKKLHDPVEFRVITALKGRLSEYIFICNDEKSVETYDLNGYNAKEMIVFLRNGDACLTRTRGMSSTVRVSDGFAFTWAIHGQPPKQRVQEFVRTIRQIVSGKEPSR